MKAIELECAAELERIRSERKPTKRGIMICGQIMGQMLQLGWKKSQLDALELLFWSVRDGNGEVIASSSGRPRSTRRQPRSP